MDETVLRLALQSAGFAVTVEQARLLAAHLEAVRAANVTQNLTRITEPEEMVRSHVMDSLLGLPELDAAPPGPLLDIGSGAGFPGIPLAIVSGRPTTLVESRGRKAAFLERTIDLLGMQVEVRNERAEETARERPASFAAVTARALAPLPSLVELAAPLLLPRGVLIAYKGHPGEGELARGDSAARIVGLQRRSAAETTVAGTDARRTLVVYELVAAPSLSLPRRPGLAQRRPLA